MTLENKRITFWAELEAYEEECQLANVFGETYEPYYVQYDARGFDGMTDEIIKMYAQVPAYAAFTKELPGWAAEYKAKERDRRRALIKGRRIFIR